MTRSPGLDPYLRSVENAPPFRWTGRITRLTGNLIESDGPRCAPGEQCEFEDARGNRTPGEVVGFRGETVLSMPLGPVPELRYGDTMTTRGEPARLEVGDELLGRVIDGAGRPLDGRGPVHAADSWPLDGTAPALLERRPIRNALACGVRAVDGFVTCGEGQRLGIFGGSGVGKSTLIGMMTRNTEADVTVVGLVGERGREVREFLDQSLGATGRERSVVVVSTSDQSPLLRIRAAMAATAAAEYFAAQGRRVLLVIDSLTRFAMAQREIGLAAGEPPTAKGYTPSVFNRLARLVERAGQFRRGSVTAFYTVMMEGDDLHDPLVDTARSLLDGHIVLDRKLAARNHYPPVSVLDSLSRLMPVVSEPAHLEQAAKLRALLAAYRESEELIQAGVYQKGTDPATDRAIAVRPALDKFLQQDVEADAPFAETHEALAALAATAVVVES